MRANSHVAVFARMAASGSLFAKVRWPGRVCVLHVDDLAQGLLIAAEHPAAAGRTFFAAGEPISIGEILDRTTPDRPRIGLEAVAPLLRLITPLLPFQAKVLLRPALAVDDTALRRLGWNLKHDKYESISGVIEREHRRLDTALPLLGRTVVTGAASGLGKALATALALRKRRLLLIDRDLDGLNKVCEGKADVERVRCDFADEDAVNALLESSSWSREPIDEIFACAGLGLRGSVASLSYQSQADILRVNVLARVQLVHNALSQMRARQFGRIILISSSSAYQALPFMTVYAASNAALLLFGEGLASEIREEGIEILTVCPGGMRTGFQKNSGVKELPDEELMAPENVAQEILESLGENRIVIMPSFRSKAMSVLARILPRKISLAFWRHMMDKLR